MELGKDIEDSVIEEKIKAQKPEQCALLIYTVSTEELICKKHIKLIILLFIMVIHTTFSLAQRETLKVS